MKCDGKELGKVSITIEGVYNPDKEYDRLSLVISNNGIDSYISVKYVPIGIDLSNIEYWQPFGSINQEAIEKYDSIQSDVNKSKKDIININNIIDDIRVKLLTINRLANNNYEAINNINNSINSLQTITNTNKDNIDKLNNKIIDNKTDIDEKIDNIDNQISNVRTDLSVPIENNQNDIKKLKEEVNKNTNKLNSVYTSNEVDDIISSIGDQIDTVNNTLLDYKVDIETTNISINNLAKYVNEKINDINAELTNIKNEISELKKNL